MARYTQSVRPPFFSPITFAVARQCSPSILQAVCSQAIRQDFLKGRSKPYLGLLMVTMALPVTGFAQDDVVNGSAKNAVQTSPPISQANPNYNPTLLTANQDLGVSQAATLVGNPMAINAVIAQAVQTHPLIGAARADEQATAESITAAKLGLYPAPSFTSGYDNTNGPITQATIRQPLWSGGKLSAAVNQAIYDDKAAGAYVYEQQNTVAKNTIDIWQSYIYAIALQQLYVNNLKRLDEFEGMMKRRVDQGVSARIELDLITNRILQDQNSLQGAQEQQRIAEARLSQMIGQPIPHTTGQAINLNAMAKYAKQQSGAFEQMAFDQASFNNPSVIKQKYQVEAAKQQVKVQQANRYPTVYAQYQDVYYHRTHSNDGQFSLGLSYDPGAGFSNLALARASQARVQSLVQSQEAARRTVMEDIQTQYQQFVSAKDQENSLVAAVAGAQIVVESYRRQFIAGRKTWLEVLNAVREQAQYEQQLLQVQSQILASFYKLQVAFGVMPWQQSQHDTGVTTEFHPYTEIQHWLREQPDNLKQTYSNAKTAVRSAKLNVPATAAGLDMPVSDTPVAEMPTSVTQTDTMTDNLASVSTATTPPPVTVPVIEPTTAIPTSPN